MFSMAQVDTLVILDRAVDLLSTLPTQLTYEGDARLNFVPGTRSSAAESGLSEYQRLQRIITLFLGWRRKRTRSNKKLV
jgi:hypothetical protein